MFVSGGAVPFTQARKCVTVPWSIGFSVSVAPVSETSVCLRRNPSVSTRARQSSRLICTIPVGVMCGGEVWSDTGWNTGLPVETVESCFCIWAILGVDSFQLSCTIFLNCDSQFAPSVFEQKVARVCLPIYKFECSRYLCACTARGGVPPAGAFPLSPLYIALILYIYDPMLPSAHTRININVHINCAPSAVRFN